MTEIQRLNNLIIPEAVQKALPHNIPIYLVGGAIRDALIGRRVEDLDFVLPTQALKTARRLANALSSDFYVLDDEREIGRVIISKEQGGRQILDFALQRHENLEGDLTARDFTINAMAIDINNPQQVIDPLGGGHDLHARILRTCSAASISDDPVRILRAIRMATLFQLRIHPDTLRQIRQGVEKICLVSTERIRDEIYRILDTPGCASSIRVLDSLGVLKVLFPELETLKNESTLHDDRKDQWEYTLDVLNRMEVLLSTLAPQPDPESGNNLMLGLVALKLGRYRKLLNTHLRKELTPSRSARQTLLFSVLFHRYHESKSRVGEALDGPYSTHKRSAIIKSRMQSLCLGNVEIDRMMKIMTNYSLPQLGNDHGAMPTRREIYRYFKATGESGIDAGLLYLVNKMAMGGLDLTADQFVHALSIVRALYEAWWEKFNEVISPTPWVNGNEIMESFQLAPGPLLGKILSDVQEAQAAGEVNSKEEALAQVSHLIKRYHGYISDY
ncbi:MAG: CCA tRNA nucleotidyltransferase [Anaerolineales bacterium]|nr:CCA tRNA nucleotidyltransferase [Anaerolineales bacterium]